MWLGKADPVETMEEIRGDDPELTALRAVATAWCDAFPGGQSVTVADVVKTAVEQQGGGFGGEAREFVNEDLREALMTVAGRGPSISGRELGRWLGNTKGRIVDGMHFECMGERRRVAVWRLVDKG